MPIIRHMAGHCPGIAACGHLRNCVQKGSFWLYPEFTVICARPYARVITLGASETVGTYGARMTLVGPYPCLPHTPAGLGGSVAHFMDLYRASFGPFWGLFGGCIGCVYRVHLPTTGPAYAPSLSNR